jgi:hypothetical protein
MEDLKLDVVIAHHIERVLRMTQYNRTHAARISGLPLSTLRSKMKRLGIGKAGSSKFDEPRLLDGAWRSEPARAVLDDWR